MPQRALNWRRISLLLLLAMQDIARMADCESKAVLLIRKDAARVVKELLKCLRPKQPRETRELIAKGISYFMCRNQSRALGEMLAISDGMKGGLAHDMRELPGVQMVNRP